MAQIPLQEYLEEIETLIDESRLGEATAHCRHILERYPRFLGAYRLLGKALLEQNAHADAADVFRRVLSADPEDFLAHVGLAIVHKEDEAFLEALWHMERAFEQDPYNAAIQEEMKELYGRRDGLAPEQVPLTRGALARLYVKGELYQQAVAELHDLLAADPDRLDLQALLAEALWRDGRRVDAVERCQHILTRLPLCIKANAILAEVWLLTGREDEAREYLQRLHELTLLSQGQLSGDSPAVHAFRADGAIPLPELILIERLPEEMALGAASAAEGAGWVQEIDFEGGETLDDDFDWLEALQSEPEEAEPVGAPLVDDDEEVMDWLRGVATQGEATGELADAGGAEQDAVPDDAGWLAESESVDDGEEAVTDDLPDWFEEVDDDEVDLGPTADWFSESAESDAGEAGFDEEMEWEAWMASGQEEASAGDDEEWPTGSAGESGGDEAEPEFEGAHALEDESFPDWLQGEEAADADETGPLMGMDAQREDAPDEQFQVEEVAMGTTDDHGKEWEDLPDEEARRNEQRETEETTPEEDLDWLDELKEAGEADQAVSGDEPAATADDLPDWLRDEMESAAGTDETLDWLEEAPGEGSLSDEEAEELPAGDMPDWLKEEGQEAAAPDEKEAVADDDLSWLDQIAAGAGEPIEEGPTLEWPETESGESEMPGDIPREVASPKEEDDLEASPQTPPEDSEEVVEAGEGNREMTAAGEGAGPAEESDAPDDVPSDVPEDLDEAMDWLEQMAEEDEAAGAPETAAEMEAETGLDWLDDLAAGEGDEEEEWLEAAPAEDVLPAEEISETGAQAEEPAAAVGDQAEPEQEAEQLAEAAASAPEEADDLDWLDEIAAEDAGREEGWLEDLPEDEDLVDAEEVDSLLGAGDADIEAAEMEEEPTAEESFGSEEDVPEEAIGLERADATEGADAPPDVTAAALEDEGATDLDWLDEIAAEEIEEEGALPEDEDLVDEEEVDSVLGAPEERSPEAAEEAAEDLSDVPEDEEEAMAWLERLAAKQGASLDELPSLQEEPFSEEEPPESEGAPDWLDELEIEEAEFELEAEAQAPMESDAGEEEPPAEEDLEWLDELVTGAEEDAAEEDVDWLAEEETADAEVAAEMEAAVDEDLSWLDDLETEEAPAEVSAEPETPGEVDEAMAWLADLVTEEEAPDQEGGPPPEAAPADEALAGLSDEIPDDPDEALAWLEQLAGTEVSEAPETPVVEEQSTPVAPQDVVAARAQAEAAAFYEEERDVAEEDLEGEQQEVAPEAPEEAEAEVAAGYDEGEEERSAPLPAEEQAEPPVETPALDEAAAAEDLEFFAEEAGLDIPEDPDEAMAWLERLAARQGASLDELPTVETAEEEVETPAWIAREMEESAAAEEAVAPEEVVAPEEAAAMPESMDADEAIAEEILTEEEAEEEVPVDEVPTLEESVAMEEAAPEEAVAPEEAAAPDEIVSPDEIAGEEIAEDESLIEKESEEEAPADELPVVEEPLAGMEITEPEPAAPAEVEPEPSLVEDLDDDFLGDLDEDDFDDSLPDWLKMDEAAAFGWGDAEPDVTGWLQAEEEATQYDLEIPEVPTDWETPADVEPVTEEATPGAEEEAPPLQPLPPAAALDLDQERLESARAALDTGDYEAAVADYRALLDAGEGINALIAEMESQVAAHSHVSTLRELLGDAYMRNGQLQKALDAYRQALDQL